MQNGVFCHINNMKSYIFALVLCAGLFPAGCRDSPVDPEYVLKLPDIPQGWQAVLGEPKWQAEWFNDRGLKKTAIIHGTGGIEVSLLQTQAGAVLALPFWPEKGIRPGVFRPAGAIFPFDVSGKAVVLSWRGGVDAVLFRELASAGNTAGSAGNRLPQNFDWPRFRLLFDDPALNAEVRGDPWLADWSGIAKKTVQSGFDRRRLVPETRGMLKVSAGTGPWIGTSPFAAPLLFESDPVFPVRPDVDTWVSEEGLLHCNTETWILHKW